MKVNVSKFLKFLAELHVEDNMCDILIDGPAAGEEQNGFLDINITLNAEAMNKLIASGLVKQKERDQWGVRYKIVEEQNAPEEN